MHLYRLAPDGDFAATDAEGLLRALNSDPLSVKPAEWALGEVVESSSPPLFPISPGKIVGIGRSYRDHAVELGNPIPEEPIVFLKAISAVIGPGQAIELPPESERVEYEGEIALVVGGRLRRASPEDAISSLLGVTCANDVTARDLQRSDPCFARAKSFDTFCPLGPAIRIDPDLDRLEVVTRLNGEERQRGKASQIAWSFGELLAYASAIMTLQPGDVVLTGSPAGVGRLQPGDVVSVEIDQVGSLENPVKLAVSED